MKLVEEPPIRKLTAAEAPMLVRNFRFSCQLFADSLEEHGSEVVTRQGKPDFPIASSARTAANMAGMGFFRLRGSRPEIHVFAYMLGGDAAGLIKCAGEDNGCEFVDSIACNPGLSGCSAALLERAVQLSIDNGRGGKLSLLPVSSEVDRIYRSYGFIEKEPGSAKLCLDPATSPQWQLISTRSRLRYRMLPPLSYIGD